MATQITYRGYEIYSARDFGPAFSFWHGDECRGYGESKQDCRDQIDLQIANAQALSDRDGRRA